MRDLIMQCIIIGLIGSSIGGYAAFLFFRFDKSWKQVFLGFGTLISTGGIWKIIDMYFNISQENKTVIILVLVVSVILAFGLCFGLLILSLKNQTGKNIIRGLDVMLGYSEFLKIYYESRMKEIDNIVIPEELEKKKKELENKENYLAILKENIDEQKKESLTLNLPEDSAYVITKRFVREIPYFVKHICNFENNIKKLTEDFMDIFTDDAQYNAECLKGYFTGIGLYIANDLFGTSNEDVRTHFRVLKGNQYVQYSVVVGQRISDDKISDIPKEDSGIIGRSYELKKSLVASLNPDKVYNTGTQWEDYMTITYYNLVEDGYPFLSMGISIKYSEQFKDMLYFLNYYKIEEILQVLMNSINKKCNIVETLREV